MSDLLSNLGAVLDQQFSSGENKNKTAQTGNLSYDRSAQRQYLEQGYFRNHTADNIVKQLEIINQQPETTVLIKKRAFSSLAEHYRQDLMDADEALFLRATKVLFRNKCRAIEAYERLTKVAQVTTTLGSADSSLLPIVFGATDALSAAGIGLGKFADTVDRIRNILAFNKDNNYVTWQAAPNESFKNSFGEGTGVIELTTVKSLTTSTSTQFSGGSFGLEISDPYNLMSIRYNDIEQALSDLVSLSSVGAFNLINQLSQETIDLQKQQLNLIRTSRGASPIIILIDPGTFIGKRVRAIIDGIGFEIQFDASSTGSATFDPGALFGNSADLGDEGLQPGEANLLSNIIVATYNTLSILQNSRRRATSNSKKNDQLNALRKKLRLHYMNKLIIQPMDTVSIFFNSKKQVDSQIIGGLQPALTGLNYGQAAQSLLNGLKDFLNPSGSIEKAIFVGSDFPDSLWTIFRSQFISDRQGCCVFTGVVEGASSLFSQGVYNVSVNGKDNASFFEHGIINKQPSVDVYNGSLFDPLTPFKETYDTATGKNITLQEGGTPELLDENKNLFKSAFIRTPNGPLAGTVPTEEGYFNRQNASTQTRSAILPFYDPQGLVYRWKQGIGSLVLGGDSYIPTGQQRGQSITTDPFAGQDIMNVISLLVTGEPYNYTSFFKATTQFNRMTRDALTGADSASSYFRGLRQDIKNNNAIYGNFIPFKRLIMDEAAFEQVLTSQMKITAQDTELQRLTQQRAELADRLALFPANADGVEDIRRALKEYDTYIQTRVTEIQQELTSSSSTNPIRILGDDISYQSNDALSIKGKDPSPSQRKELRRKTHFLTRRLPWKVRANEDQNYFIVDDTYDKDYDIQAFEKSITDFSLYKSEYTTAMQQIRSAAEKLQLEIFSNTQGHIEIRSPKYNNIPSSVFNRMLRQKDETGAEVFPQFLQDLFTTQLQDLYQSIEVIEDRIRLYCYVLGNNDDASAARFIYSLGGQNVAIGSGTFGSGAFKFVTDWQTGEITQSGGDLISQSQVSAFSTIDRARLVQSVDYAPQGVAPGTFKSASDVQSQASSSDYFNQIQARLTLKTGQSFNIQQEYGTDPNVPVKLAKSSVVILQVGNKIAALLQQREQAIKTAANALQNLQSGANANTSTGTRNLLMPSASTGQNIPKSLDHMIEDESYDDYGFGSKDRYVIKNRDIISYSKEERRPTMTAVSVSGNFGDNFIPVNQLPGELNDQFGNRLASAQAVDYDLWRMYGISLPQNVDAPFLSNPDTQLAPYAVSILNRSRKEILQGSCTVVGNEFQQPGEVIYIENDDLLFYVEKVNHSFSYGGSFTTTLTLSYGHNPGEYIPTPLDVVGKVLYKNNQHLTKMDHRRQGNSFNQEHLGALAVNLAGTTGNDVFINQYATVNRSSLDQIVSAAIPALSQKNDNYNPQLELRVYYNDKAGYDIPTRVGSIAQEIQDYLVGASVNIPGPGSISPVGLQPDPTRLSAYKDQVSVLTTNTNPDKKDYRYASSKAFYLARRIAQEVHGKQTPDQTEIDQNINNYVIDVWITYENLVKNSG